jgi:hypothetical protein
MGSNKAIRWLATGAVALFTAACGSSGSGDGGDAGAGATVVPLTSAAAPSTSAAPTTSAAGSSSPAASGPDVTKPCSFLSDAEVAAIVNVQVQGQDEGFRCRYFAGANWLQVELMEASSASSQQIFDYDKQHGTAAPGLGDEAYFFGAQVVAKLGDVLVDVDGSNLDQAPSNDQLNALAGKIISRIP